jgi:hypothetical protein
MGLWSLSRAPGWTFHKESYAHLLYLHPPDLLVLAAGDIILIPDQTISKAHFSIMSNTTASPNGPHIEKDYGERQYNLGGSEDPENALRKIRTAGSISISPELFEKVILPFRYCVLFQL